VGSVSTQQVQVLFGVQTPNGELKGAAPKRQSSLVRHSTQVPLLWDGSQMGVSAEQGSQSTPQASFVVPQVSHAPAMQ
jgi:hypothetical protein